MSWVAELDAALGRSSDEDEDRIEVLRGRVPPMLDSTTTRAALAPMLAGLTWAAVALREMVAGTSLDPLALLMRVLALGLTLRLFILGAQMWRRLRVYFRSSRYALALGPEGLLYRRPEGDLVLRKADVIAIAERGRWQERASGPRWNVVYLTTDPGSGQLFVELPPVFDASPGRLAERLMRWRGATEAQPHERAEPDDELAGRAYEIAATGRAPRGTVAVRHGWGWLRKGPYATVLLGIAIVEGLVRAGPAAWRVLDPTLFGGLAITLAAVPLVWAWIRRREIGPRRGLALVLTPKQLLLHARGALIPVPWSDLSRATTDAKRSWTVLEGYHEARELVLRRRDGSTIRYAEAFLGIPVEVAQAFCDAYRRGELPRSVGEPRAEPVQTAAQSGLEERGDAARDAG